MLRYGQPEDCGAVQQQDRHREEHQMVSTASQLARKVKDMISYQKHTKDSLAKRVFFNEPASPPHVTPRVGYVHPCPPELKWAAPVPKEAKT